MKVDSVIQQGLQGMQQSHRAISDAAQQIVEAGTDPAGADVMDIAEPLINMRIEQHLFDASAKVVEVGDELLGTLLDMDA